MLETLLKLLAIDAPAPEILLEEDGDISLDWAPNLLAVSINPQGGVAWALRDPAESGTSLERLCDILDSHEFQRKFVNE